MNDQTHMYEEINLTIVKNRNVNRCNKKEY